MGPRHAPTALFVVAGIEAGQRSTKGGHIVLREWPWNPPDELIELVTARYLLGDAAAAN